MLDADGNGPGVSPRSGRKHKAWGVSPRFESQKAIEPAKRAMALALNNFSK